MQKHNAPRKKSFIAIYRNIEEVSIFELKIEAASERAARYIAEHDKIEAKVEEVIFIDIIPDCDGCIGCAGCQRRR